MSFFQQLYIAPPEAISPNQLELPIHHSAHKQAVYFNTATITTGRWNF